MTPFEMIALVLLAATLFVAILALLRAGRSDVAPLTAKIEQLSARLGEAQAAFAAGLSGLRDENAAGARAAREELGGRLDAFSTTMTTAVGALGTAQSDRLDALGKAVSNARIESENHAGSLRKELIASFDAASRKQVEGLAGATGSVKEMADANERRQETLRQTVEARLDALRTENTAKLEEMRVTVDEKLQGTLEARLGSSFTTVNENLERVYKSVGEMQTIATGVGDLKRVLTNVKLRGSYGETTLGMLLEQVMTNEQYGQNIEVKPGSGCRVEYAVKLPGQGDGPVWLPIDVKLPKEDYERLVDASERGDPAAVEEATKGLERTIRKCAADISDKYIDPPHSTDFAIMFLPTEGLFAEVTRRPGLIDTLQRECRVIVAGPTTLMATLVSLRMGFRSLAIQKRSSEVWQVLGAVKSEFGKFGDVLDKVQKKLGEAQNVVESAGTRRRAMDRQLRKVEALPEATARDVLAITADELADEIEEAAE